MPVTARTRSLAVRGHATAGRVRRRHRPVPPGLRLKRVRGLQSLASTGGSAPAFSATAYRRLDRRRPGPPDEPCLPERCSPGTATCTGTAAGAGPRRGRVRRARAGARETTRDTRRSEAVQPAGRVPTRQTSPARPGAPPPPCGALQDRVAMGEVRDRTAAGRPIRRWDGARSQGPVSVRQDRRHALVGASSASSRAADVSPPPARPRGRPPRPRAARLPAVPLQRSGRKSRTSSAQRIRRDAAGQPVLIADAGPSRISTPVSRTCGTRRGSTEPRCMVLLCGRGATASRHTPVPCCLPAHPGTACEGPGRPRHVPRDARAPMARPVAAHRP